MVDPSTVDTGRIVRTERGRSLPVASRWIGNFLQVVGWVVAIPSAIIGFSGLQGGYGYVLVFFFLPLSLLAMGIAALGGLLSEQGNARKWAGTFLVGAGWLLAIFGGVAALRILQIGSGNRLSAVFGTFIPLCLLGIGMVAVGGLLANRRRSTRESQGSLPQERQDHHA